MARTTLEQWRMFRAVAEAGSFAAAAERVHKSTSTVHHAIQTLRERLGVELFESGPRGLRLTEAGQALWRRASVLLEEAQAIERVAAALRDGVEAELRVAVDQLVPAEALRPVLARFVAKFPNVRLVWIESLLSGGQEAFEDGRVEVLIGTHVPVTEVGGSFGTLRMRPVVAPGHRLATVPVASLKALRDERQIVIRDSGTRLNADGGWTEARARWAVSHVTTARQRVLEGFGFAWLPEWLIRDDLDAGRLVEVRVRHAAETLQETPQASEPHASRSSAARASSEPGSDAFEWVTLRWVARSPNDLGPAGRFFVQALTERAREWSRRGGQPPARRSCDAS